MEEKLYQVCSDGKVEEVQKLLQNEQININWQNQNDYFKTPFYRACGYGHIKIVKLLLNDNRIDINKADNFGWTPFHIACFNGHIDIVKLLLNDNRIDLTKADNDGWTPFYVACYNGYVEIVKLLLNDNRIDLNKANNHGWTPLYSTCEKGRTEIVKLLLNDERVDINKTTNDYGRTPFLIACCNGKTEVVKYLLESGKEIDINKKDNNGKTGLDWAKQKGNTDIVELIESFQKNPNETRANLRKEFAVYEIQMQFWEACSEGKVDEVRKLLQSEQININQASDGKTPFFISCEKGHIEIVKLLLNDHRIDINKAEKDGSTPFHIACYNGYIDIVKLLLNDLRIDTNKAKNDDRTPFWIACDYGHIEIVKLLLNDNRVDINKAANEGDNYLKTPFWIACGNGHIEIVKLLLNDNRIDFNKASNRGYTPFYVACYDGHIEIVKLLLNDERVDINKADNGGETPFYIACQGDYNEGYTIDIVLLLLETPRELKKIPKHEDCKDKLVSFTFEQMKETTDKLIFISHRWLSQDHPDAHSEQLNAIKDSLKSDPSHHRILIWYDYFSMPQHFDEGSKQKRVDTIYRLNQIVTFSDSFLVLPTEDYFHRCWCFYEWSAAVFTGQQIQFYPNKFQTSEESLSFLSELMSSFHDENNDDKPSKDQFIQKFIAFIESDKNLVWDNLMKVYDEETVIRYKKKLDTTQVRNWTIDEVCSWLISIRFSQYQNIFKKHKINGESLFNLYFEHQNLFQKDEDYHLFLKKLEILIPFETWNEIDFSLWIKSQNWNETGITEECCQVIKDLKLFPKAILKDQIIEREHLKEFLISEILGNVLIWKYEKGSIDNILWYLDGPFKDIINVNSTIGFRIVSPFYVACENGHTDIVKLLLSNEKVDINKSNNNGWTPLYYACEKGHIEIVKLLLNDNRIDVNKAESDELTTPLYTACYNGHIEIVKLLLNDERTDINKAANDGWTPLYIACQSGLIEIVKLLLNDSRIDINKAKNDGWTPFYIACEKRLIQIVKLLLNDQRVDINKTANNGSTPFLIACDYGKTEVVKYLLESGREIDINKKDKYGKTGLDYAKENGKTDIVKLIESFQMKIEN